MMLLITIGVPLVFAVLIYRSRHRINPPCKDQMTAVRLRMQDSEIAHLTFLFKDYKPACLFTEPLELLRRAFLIGVVGFCGETANTQSAVGVAAALFSFIVYREVQPFTDRLTNMLANIAQWMCFTAFLGAFLIETRPFGYSDNSLGGILFLFFLVIVAASVYVDAPSKQRPAGHLY